MKILPLVLVILVVILAAPSAFACSHCYSDAYGCAVCVEDGYDGAQSCTINDVVWCQENLSCDGPDGTEICGTGPCVHTFNLADNSTRQRQWEVASATFFPPIRKPHARKG